METPLFNRFLKIYRKLSHTKRRFLCLCLKSIKFPLGSNYKKLKFDGIFKVNVDKEESFQMFHYGGEIENETFWKGLFQTWEAETGWLWKELCKSSNIIMDVGANTGIYSLSAFCLNPKAKIYAFEPSVHTFKKLNYNIEINNYLIKSEQLAISNKTNQQMFYDLPYKNQTGASLSVEMMKNNSTVDYIVNTTTLKDYIELNEIKTIDLIKLDVELHEAEAIEGLGQYIVLFKPLIILEMLTQKVADNLSKYIDLKDFHLFHLGVNKVEQIYSFKIEKESLSRGDWNYFIFHKSLEDKIKKNTSLYSKICS